MNLDLTLLTTSCSSNQIGWKWFHCQSNCNVLQLALRCKEMPYISSKFNQSSKSSFLWNIQKVVFLIFIRWLNSYETFLAKGPFDLQYLPKNVHFVIVTMKLYEYGCRESKDCPMGASTLPMVFSRIMKQNQTGDVNQNCSPEVRVYLHL